MLPLCRLQLPESACMHGDSVTGKEALQAQHEAESTQRKLQAQRSACALVQRALILHGSKLVALAAFGAALQAPGFLGWVLTCALQPQPIRILFCFCFCFCLECSLQAMSITTSNEFVHVRSGSWRNCVRSASGWACCNGARPASPAWLRAWCS